MRKAILTYITSLRFGNEANNAFREEQNKYNRGKYLLILLSVQMLHCDKKTQAEAMHYRHKCQQRPKSGKTTRENFY